MRGQGKDGLDFRFGGPGAGESSRHGPEARRDEPLNERDDAMQETEAPRERISALAAAILRINASLDVDSVLREVVDSARALTGAHHGLIATTDERGEVQDFVTSGVGPDQLRAVTEWPDGPRLFEHLHGLAAPLRLPSFDGYLRSLGHAPFPVPYGTFLAMPMRHRHLHVGVFFLGQKEAAFTDEDEEVLVLFASQAATALANARAHRAEQRARADLEALVETCPVGVVVFDAATGRPLSFNREARRLVVGLQVPGHTVAQVAAMLTCRFADGREATLGDAGGAPSGCAPRRWSSRSPTVAACGRCSTSPLSRPPGARSRRWW